MTRETTNPPGPWHARRRLAAGLILLGLAVTVYAPAMNGGFVWDDETLITGNPVVQAPDGLRRIWLTTESTDYFPLTYTSFWIQWRLWGNDPAGFHLVNVLLHAAGCLVLWRVLVGLGIPGAWLGAAVFAVHPVNVASVAWISEQKNTLSQLLFLLALWAYLRHSVTGGRRMYVAALACFLLALLAKTSVVMLPVVLLGINWWLRGRVDRRQVVASIPFFALSAILGLVTVWFQYHQAIGDEVVRPEGFVSRLAAAGWAVWFYVCKALLPVGLSMVYPRWQIDPVTVVDLLPTLALVACLLILWRHRHSRGRAGLAGLGYTVVMLLPVLGFANMAFMKYSLVADHFQYAALPGILALVIGTAVHGWKRRGMSLPGGIILAAVVVAALSGLTWQRQSIFQDNGTFLRDTVARTPGCATMRYNLGTHLAIQGQLVEAREHLAAAVELDPANWEYRNNLGRLYSVTDRPGLAIQHYTEAARLASDDATPHNNLAMLLSRLGRVEEAIVHHQRAVELEPRSAELHYNLARALQQQGRIEEALPGFRETLRLRPDWPPALDSLTWALSSKPNPTPPEIAEAISVARRLCVLTGHSSPEPICALAAAYDAAGRVADAKRELHRALELARNMGNTALASGIETRLAAYPEDEASGNAAP